MTKKYYEIVEVYFLRIFPAVYNVWSGEVGEVRQWRLLSCNRYRSEVTEAVVLLSINVEVHKAFVSGASRQDLTFPLRE